MKTPLFTITALLLAASLGCGQTMPPETRAKLDELTGTWRGVFEVFTQDGRLATRLEVEQTYAWEGDVQVARFIEVDRDGNRTTADARNYVNDAGELVCEVDKSNGESSRHLGRIEAGKIVWYRAEDAAIETFVETVETDRDPPVYDITGMGGYGEPGSRSFFVFRGRYAKVSGAAE